MGGLLEKEIIADKNSSDKVLSIEKFKLKYLLKEDGILWRENKEKKSLVWIRVNRH